MNVHLPHIRDIMRGYAEKRILRDLI